LPFEEEDKQWKCEQFVCHTVVDEMGNESCRRMADNLQSISEKLAFGAEHVGCSSGLKGAEGRNLVRVRQSGEEHDELVS